MEHLEASAPATNEIANARIASSKAYRLRHCR